MWEEAIPWIWGWAQEWLTPAVLFVLLNLVIGTIAVTSKGIVPRDPQPPAGAAGAAGAGADELPPADAPPRKLPRTPSRLLDRLRSFTLQPQPQPQPQPHPNLRGAAPPQALAGEDKNRADPDEDGEEEEEELRLPHDHGHQLGRSHSDAHPAAGESPPQPPLAARMKKSASEKSAFAHFEAAEVADAAAAEAEPGDEDDDEAGGGGGGGEVDARADDFINRFRHQLKLQRIDSITRYKETLNRNGGGGRGSTPPNQLK